MARQTFGQALGELIFQKRHGLGLTQTQLAEDAYNTSTKTRRISELESGLVANPHPKTIDPIISVLNITSAEIEECARRANKRPDNDLDRAYREARNLIDAIARQFEHIQPNASLAELDDFLRGKAAEWAMLRDRIATIDASEAALTKLREEATIALAEGQFKKVDELLAQAEERHQNDRTLAEIRKHAAIRVSRGDNSLLSGNPDSALAYYKSAAEFFRPFDEKEMVQILQEIAFRIYENAKRSLQPTFHVAAELLGMILTVDHTKRDAKLAAEVNYRLGLVLRNEYVVSRPGTKDDILDRAVVYSRQAAAYPGEKEEVFLVASMKISLANLLMDRAKLARSSAVTDITEAQSLLQSLRLTLRDDREAQELRAHTCNSLGAALLASRFLVPNIDANAVFEQALDAFRETLEISEAHSDIENWGAAKANIGGVLAELANTKSLEEYQQHFLRVRAICEFSSAAETVPILIYPVPAAGIHEGLASILVEHAVALNNEMSEMYLFRAVQSYETAGAMLTREGHPRRWANTRERIGSIFAHHSRLPNVVSPEDDIARAIAYLEEATAAFEEAGDDQAAARSRAKIASLRS